MNGGQTSARPAISKVALVGTGVIGRSWIQVFIRAGCQAALYDREPAQIEKALAWVEQDLEQDVQEGWIDSQEASARRDRIEVPGSLEEALSGAGYIQESGPERTDLKRQVFEEIDRIAEPDAILASSTSSLNMTEITSDLPGAHRCIVAHPFNPPHMIPVVEIVPGDRTDPGKVEAAYTFLSSVGQKPVTMKFHLTGFLGNRMQVALIREALNLVKSGAADIDAIDAVVSDGLGLRWALMGPFGVASTNADTGVREYYTRYQQTYIDLMDALAPTPAFDAELIEEIGKATDEMFADTSLGDVRRWRDQMIRKLVRLKQETPQP